MGQKDGGPAFAEGGVFNPAYGDYGRVEWGSGGLSKREWFAGLAMQGIIAANIDFDRQWHPDGIAKDAVEAADALLAELAKDE